ncbi:MAG: formylglycine-generating enzyme family protein [Anaerolineae bacterium]|nr:formylglycine-generating enzyme family protein [Anaerolineae bacterium]
MTITLCEIPAGTYPIGDPRLSYSRPPHTVELKTFSIAKTTVTNVEFLAFIAAGGYATERYWSEMGWRWLDGKTENYPAFLNDPHFNMPDQPIVGVSWYEADAYTRWLAEHEGIPWRLPSEAEWEAAARGEEGEAPRPRNYNTIERRIARPWAVTEVGNLSWCGAADMCGNVWEWCSTRWGRNWQTMEYRYPYNAGDGREHLDGSHARLIRGGSWFDAINESNPANRARYLPGSRGSNIGFRLARSSG